MHEHGEHVEEVIKALSSHTVYKDGRVVLSLTLLGVQFDFKLCIYLILQSS